MNEKKYTAFLTIQKFISEVPPEKYSQYFSSREIAIFGSRKNKGSLAVRYALKQKLKEIFNSTTPYNKIEILNKSNGQAILEWKSAPREKKIHFSLSHSKEEVAVLIVVETSDL